jgi:hypothetical protein
MKRLKGSNQYYTRLSRRTRVAKRINLIRLYIALGITLGVFAYIIARGTIDLAKDIFTMRVYAPTHKVYAKEITPTPTLPELAPAKDQEQVIALIRKIWGKDAPIGIAIARCESGFKVAGPHVANTNHSIDQGVFSINSIHQMPDMENATANIAYAYSMYLTQGTTPWDSSKSCWNQ